MTSSVSRALTRRQAELLLAAIIIARSTALLFSKLALQTLEPFTLMGYRFLLAFLVLLLLFRRRLHPDAATVHSSLLIGLSFYIVMAAELHGLKLTDSSSTTSLLEHTAIVLVPLLEAVLRRRLPRLPALGSALVTLLGITLLLSGGSALSWTGGEMICLLAALFYAITMILTDRLSHTGDPLTIGVFQLGFIALFSLTSAFLWETPQLPAGAPEWGAILWLTLVCSAFGFTMQPVAQRHTTAERAALFCALSPLSSSVLAFLFLHEPFGLRALFGAMLILAGILISTHWGSERASAA